MMSSLSDRLRALGVKVGTKNLQPSKPRLQLDHPIDSVLPGNWYPTPQGEVFTVETRYRKDFRVGNIELKPSSTLKIVAAWAREPQLLNFNLDQFAFIDTETTGLSSGAGTLAFLIGVGRFEGDEFRVSQFFLHEPGEELAQLAAVEEFLSRCEVIVSFNGKSFDLPVIKTRFITNGWSPPLIQAPHLDLLHLARRLWKSRLPNRALGELEVKILGTKRSEQDVPSWMVSDLYFDYLQTGDARPLRGVFYHNEVDIVSLAALLSHMSNVVADPLNTPMEYGADIIAIGKLYADLGYLDTAAKIYKRGLNRGDVKGDAYWSAVKQLSLVHKKRGDFQAAMELWEQAAMNEQIYAHEELAKTFEHHHKDFSSALVLTDNALKILSKTASPLDRMGWIMAFEHRKNRLEMKIKKLNSQQ
jgi:uncharacterized protein YprB with RNaseH-like and TPR domain